MPIRVDGEIGEIFLLAKISMYAVYTDVIIEIFDILKITLKIPDVQLVMWDLLEVGVHWRVGLKSATTASGVLFVMIHGVHLMLELFVDS